MNKLRAAAGLRPILDEDIFEFRLIQLRPYFDI